MAEADDKKPWILWLDRLLHISTPPWLRWDVEASHELTWTQNIVFGLAAAFSVANLYYVNPILAVLAESFQVSDQRSSLIVTMLQAGYAAGLLFIVPMGDILRRRPMVLCLVLITALFWLGATLTASFSALLALSFLTGLTTVTPQLLFPLTAQYSPPRHRAVMISIVLSGLTFGSLISRVLSGIVTQYSNWRTIYWVSFGIQMAILVMLFLCVPDYPILRPGTSYPRTILSIFTLPFHHPVLIQHSLVAFFSMGMLTSFWTTLTFHLNGAPFHLSTLVIGLFALIGISPVLLNPIISFLVTSRIHPSGTVILMELLIIASIFVGTFVGTYSLAGLVIWAFFGDLGLNTVVVGNRLAIADVDLRAQNVVNSVYMVFSFCGQLFGTAVGNQLYARDGWIASGAFGIGITGATLLIMLLRGPYEKGWVGWRGGWELRNKSEPPTNSPPSLESEKVAPIEKGTENVEEQSPPIEIPLR